MTKRDFEMIAATIRTLKLPSRTLVYISITFADRLEQESLSFNRGLFLKACGLAPAWRAALS